MTNRLRFNYRHIICIAVTLSFILPGVFAFPNTPGRTIECCRDLGLSFVYFFAEIFGIEHRITATVTEPAKIPFFDFPVSSTPTAPLPETWTGFQYSWNGYWRLWATGENFLGYLDFLALILYWLCMIILIALPFILLLRLAVARYARRRNNDYNEDSKTLSAFKRMALHTYYPVKRFAVGLVLFIREHRAYRVAWLCMWLWYFNVLTVFLEFIAYYLYFVAAFDIGSIYFQVYKLFVDLAVPFTFIPVWLWVVIAFFVLNAICRKIAYSRLYRREYRNRGFINERGVVTVVYGAMGAGKTTQITDMALSAEIRFRDMAFEIILETDMKFPHFPWCNLENKIKRGIARHSIYSLDTCRRFVHSKGKEFFRLMRKGKRGAARHKCLFDYDYERYGCYYDDKLALTNIWSAIEDYACAYFIYTVQSSLLISNYSIRSDTLFSDLGNFPLWNTDFFKRDSRLIDSYSRHAHILDFDMLRLGKQMIENNPNGNAFGFGVYIISEIDKERKNTPELKEIKASASECNQKNDLFNILLKMSRHPCVVANRVFIMILADLQRPSSLGADALDLGEVLDIVDVGDMSPALPFFSPFWLFDLLYSWLKPKFDNFYVDYRYNRADNTLLLYLLKGIMAKLAKYHSGIYNLFGSQTLSLEVERGSRDGDIKPYKYYRMPKKIYSKRFATNCLSSIFETRAKANRIGIDDLREYADIMATAEELRLQNSHFQKEIQSLTDANASGSTI